MPPPCGFLSCLASEREPATLTTPRLSVRFTRRIKKTSRTLPIAEPSLTRLFEVRLLLRRRRQSALSPLRRASRSTRSKHIAHPAMSRNRFCSAANVTRRMLSYVPWKYPPGRIRRERDYCADILWKQRCSEDILRYIPWISSDVENILR